jgi:hypothetical protein
LGDVNGRIVTEVMITLMDGDKYCDLAQNQYRKPISLISNLTELQKVLLLLI